MAVAGSFRNQALADDPVFIGEVGLSGHVRPVSQMVRRVREAVKLGFTNVVMPDVEVAGLPPEARPVRVRTVAEAIRSLFGAGRPEASGKEGGSP